MTEWQLQDAKNRFCAVVDAAVAGDPQWVTRRGKPAVVVLAVEEYERLRHLEKAKALSFADLLLAMPQDDEEFERFASMSRPPVPPHPVPSRRSLGQEHHRDTVISHTHPSGTGLPVREARP